MGAVTTILESDQLWIVAATPLKVTVPPETVPKPCPLRVTCAFGNPIVGEILVRTGAKTTCNVVETEPPLEGFTTTVSAPVGMPPGTAKLMEYGPQEFAVAVTPATVTVPELPKFAPEIDTVCPEGTLSGEML